MKSFQCQCKTWYYTTDHPLSAQMPRRQYNKTHCLKSKLHLRHLPLGGGDPEKHWSSCLPARREKEEECAVKREKVDISTMKPRLLVASVPEELAPCSHSCFCVCAKCAVQVCVLFVCGSPCRQDQGKKKGKPQNPPGIAAPNPPPKDDGSEGIARLAARDILLKFLYIDL